MTVGSLQVAAKQLQARDKSSLIVPRHDGEGGVTKALLDPISRIYYSSECRKITTSTAKTP